MHSQVINLHSLKNTRDLGGILTADGHQIKKKKIIRSGELFNVDKEDIMILYKDYDLREVIDLRNKTEARQKPDLLIPGMKYIINPIFDEAQMGMTHEEETDAKTSEFVFVNRILKQGSGTDFMKSLYKEFILTPSCLASYKSFIDYFAAPQNGSILFHCSV